MLNTAIVRDNGENARAASASSAIVNDDLFLQTIIAQVITFEWIASAEVRMCTQLKRPNEICACRVCAIGAYAGGVDGGTSPRNEIVVVTIKSNSFVRN